MPPDETPKDESASVEPTPEPIVVPVIEVPQPETPLVPLEPIPEPIPIPQPLIIETPPVVETPAPPVPEPLPEPTPAPPEPQPQPIPEPPITTHQSPITDSPPPVVPTPLPRSSSEELTTGDPSPIAPPTTPPIAPAIHDSKYTKGVPKRVLELTEEEINAARLLWAREHIAEAQAQGNRNRLARMNKIMDEIEAFVRTKPNATTYEIANKMNMSKKSTSGYVQKLVKAGRINASGNSSNRRYFV